MRSIFFAILVSVLCSCRDRLPLGTVGGVEPVYLESFMEPFQGKMDTGADISSLDAKEIRECVKNGKKAVSFRVVNRESGESVELVRPVKRIVKIERHGQPAHRRYSVMLNMKLGKLELKREFTLADRSNFSCQVLIGRNVLKGKAAVDVSRENTLGDGK